MAKFFVGQRVKVVRRPHEALRPDLGCVGGRIGDEGTVVGTVARPNRGFWTDGHPDMLSVKLDRLQMHGLAPSYCFEPILPEGHRAGETGLCEPLDRLLGRVTA
jgi:hypothetical protein